MKFRHLTISLCGAILLAVPAWLASRSTGAPERKTGGDFPGETVCTDCHEGEANSGPGEVTMTIGGQALGEYRYEPGATVPIEVMVSDPDQQAWGFQLTARNEDGCSQAGTLSVSAEDGGVQVLDHTGEVEGCESSTIQYATHNMAKTGEDGATFTVEWTAPEEDFGVVRFAAAGNAANGNMTNAGDNIYTVEGEADAADGEIPMPEISEGGLVLSTGTPVIETGSANAILTAFGSGFAAEGAEYLAELDDEGNVTKMLGGVCVEVEGERAPLFFVNSTQINFQAPAETDAGSMQVTVLTGCDEDGQQSSEPVSFTFESASPGFFNFVNNETGENPIAATSADGTELIGPADLFGGDPATRPAQPGELITLYATGLGETDPSFEDGEIPGGAGEVTSDLSVMIDQTMLAEEDVQYAGVAACCAGLYQLNVVVPDNLPDGEFPVVVTVNGISSPEGPFIAVAAAEE